MTCGNELVLELFVHGQSARSIAALDVVQKVCETHFPDHYRLEVIDIYQQPERTSAAGVMVVPALIRRSPEPLRRLVGRLTEDRLLTIFGIDNG